MTWRFFQESDESLRKRPSASTPKSAKRSALNSIITGSGNTTSHSPQNRGGHEMNYVRLISLKIRLEVSCAMRLL